MKVLMFGAVGAYAAAFSRALAPHVDLRACIVRRSANGLIQHWLRRRPVLEDGALGFACPVYSVAAHEEAETYVHLRRFEADLVLVVGFPRKLPAAAVSTLGRLGALNVHPGPLPQDRGPNPVFWALRRGDLSLSVTVHVLSDTVDGGDVLLTASTPLVPGSKGYELWEGLGVLGGKLVASNLEMLSSGAWHLQPQGEPGSWARKPTREDFEVKPLEWSAKALFTFVRGARAFGMPWSMLADEVYHLSEALAFEPGRRIPGEFVVIGDELTVAVKDGTVSFRVVMK